MRPGRPKQHTHNWRIRILNPKFSRDVPESLQKYTDFGFTVRRYWGCYRGGKLKHRMDDIVQEKEAWQQVSNRASATVFIAASGFYPKERESEKVV